MIFKTAPFHDSSKVWASRVCNYLVKLITSGLYNMVVFKMAILFSEVKCKVYINIYTYVNYETNKKL